MSGISVAIKSAKIQIFDLNRGSLTDKINLMDKLTFGDKINLRLAGAVLCRLDNKKFGSFLSTLSTSGVPHSILLCANDREEDIKSEFNRITENHQLYSASDAYYDCHMQDYVQRIQRMDLDTDCLDKLLNERKKYTKVNDLIREHIRGLLPAELARKGYSVFLYSTSHKTIAKSILIGARSYLQNIEKDFADCLKIPNLYKPGQIYTRR